MKMAFFDFFFLFLAAAFLFFRCRPQYVHDVTHHRKALNLFLWSLVLFYPVSAIFMISVYLSIVTNPIAMILSILCFRFLWLSLNTPAQAALPPTAS
ncbi:hypothetical protein [Prosthecobacter sp.]|uniref:hypothetical protein n=1 Tax=Prosthecobacter sp. TaxID=1965333 RepID=UPI003784C779